MKGGTHKRGLDNKGFTLMEIIIVLFLSSLVLAAIYMVFTGSLASMGKTQEKIDAQSQFRLIVGILEQEVGTATRVELLHMADIPDPVPLGYRCIYVKSDGDYGKFYKRDSSGETEYVTPYPLKQLTMKFRQGTSDNVLEIHLKAENNEYSGGILTQNTELIYIALMADYEAVYYEVLDLE